MTFSVCSYHGVSTSCLLHGSCPRPVSLIVYLPFATAPSISSVSLGNLLPSTVAPDRCWWRRDRLELIRSSPLHWLHVDFWWYSWVRKKGKRQLNRDDVSYTHWVKCTTRFLPLWHLTVARTAKRINLNYLLLWWRSLIEIATSRLNNIDIEFYEFVVGLKWMFEL